MKIRPMSDLHVEFMSPEVRMALIEEIVTGCDADLIDVLVLAGDIGLVSDGSLALFLPALVRRLEAVSTRVVYVPGNHEYFGDAYYRLATSRARDMLQNLGDTIAYNLSYLHRGQGPTTIADQRFIGCTLWYPWNKGVQRYARNLWPDQAYTDDPRGDKWPSLEGAQDATYLRDNTVGSDIVVTHMLPHKKSVAVAWRGSGTNLMFVHPMGKLIERVSPKLWIHGHTHESCDYMHAGTRVVCNPYGYWGRDTNPRFDPRLTIET